MKNVGQDTQNNKAIIFLDANIIFSASYTDKGTSFYLVTLSDKYIQVTTSSQCLEEAQYHFFKRYNNNISKELLLNVKIDQTFDNELEKEFLKFVNDDNDAHVLVSAYYAKAKYLVTGNLKDFKVNEIYEHFRISVLSPADMIMIVRHSLDITE